MRFENLRGALALAVTAGLLTSGVVLVASPDSVDAQSGLAADLVIENNNAYLMAMGAGSRIEIHGADAQKESWTQLASPAEAGSSQIVVQESTGWEVGDFIAVASTTNQWTQAEEFTIAAISSDGRTITLNAPLQYLHRGETRNYDNGQTGEDHREWAVEVRAEVALLNRNITIQGDADSIEDGFGGHTMVMNGGELHIEGAEFDRMGQRDILGRYPIHWHMLGQTEGQYVQNVSVHNTHQKGVTIHGTSNVRVEDSVVYDHVGHGVFFEDGAENNNQILGNLVFSTRRSETGLPIKTDAEHASSYWIENPNNVFIGNHAAGSESNGFWIFENQLHGLSETAGVGEAGDLKDLIFIDNTSHTAAGSQGSSGSDKILGIDGTIRSDTDFQQRTLTGEFGIIEGFTGYEGATWSLTSEMVFSDSAFYNSRFFARHENYIEDTVLDSTNIILYRDGGNQYNNVHAVGGSSFLPLSSDHVNTPHAFNNVTGDPRVTFLGGAASHDQQSIADIDGSISGVAGGFITPNNEPFDAAPGAAALNDELVSSYTVGATEVTALEIEGNLGVVRSDGTSIVDVPNSSDRRSAGDDAADRSAANKEFFTTTGMERDLAYLLDFDDMPAELRLNLTGVRAGDAAVYEIPGIAGNYIVTDGGVRVGSFDELLNANETSYYRGESSVFVRIVAVDNGIEGDRLAIDILASYKASDSITMTISGFSGSTGELSPALISALASSAPNGLNNSAPKIFEPAKEHTTSNYKLERYPSGSVPVPVTSEMARWSENIWGGNTPGADDIVVINAGQTVVLDTTTKVEGIIVNGGELLVEDGANLNIDLSTDYLLVVNGGLFQAGTETDLLETNFTMTLEGDDAGFDLEVSAIVNGDFDRVLADTSKRSEPAEPVPTTVKPAEPVPTTVKPAEPVPTTVKPAEPVPTTVKPAEPVPTTVKPAEPAEPTPVPSRPAEPTPVPSITICAGLEATIVGTSGNDVLEGTPGDDVISGLQGNDVIRGNGGDDVICGGLGDDKIFGGEGFDVLYGAQGDDYIFGAEANSRTDTFGGRYFGGEGNDMILGTDRWDRMQGGPGSDRLYGYKGRDWMRGGEGVDRIDGGGAIDDLHGGDGNDLIITGGGDFVRGGAGIDVCDLLDGRPATAISCERQ